MEKEQRLINFAEAGQYLGLRESTFRERVRAGAIPPRVIVKIGKRYHVDRVELDAFIEDSKQG